MTEIQVEVTPVTIILPAPEEVNVTATGGPGPQGPPGATTIEGIVGLQAALDDKATNLALTSGLEGLETSKADASHTHAIGDVTGLQSALDAKATSAQGAKADTAVQPADLDPINTSIAGLGGAINSGLTSLSDALGTVSGGLSQEVSARADADTALSASAKCVVAETLPTSSPTPPFLWVDTSGGNISFWIVTD